MKIYITAENIEQGKKGCEGTCALALAFKDAGYTGVSVGDEVVALWDAEDDEFGRAKTYSLTQDLIEFVRHFDDGEDVEPMEFEFNDLILKQSIRMPTPKTYTEADRSI